MAIEKTINDVSDTCANIRSCGHTHIRRVGYPVIQKVKATGRIGVYRSRNTRRTFHRANTDSYRCGKYPYLADIGVIFLLFALGLDFSFKKLMKVGGTAVIGAITVVIGMMTAGYITGLSLGWGHMNSLFLGGMLSMSSTTIIFKAFDDMGLRNQRFAGVVFGILVVEDLFAVLLMVLLSTVAVSKHVEGMEMLDSVVKLGIFLLFCFVVGIYLIPSFLKKAKSFLNEETLLIVSIGYALVWL